MAAFGPTTKDALKSAFLTEFNAKKGELAVDGDAFFDKYYAAMIKNFGPIALSKLDDLDDEEIRKLGLDMSRSLISAFQNFRDDSENIIINYALKSLRTDLSSTINMLVFLQDFQHKDDKEGISAADAFTREVLNQISGKTAVAYANSADVGFGLMGPVNSYLIKNANEAFNYQAYYETLTTVFSGMMAKIYKEKEPFVKNGVINKLVIQGIAEIAAELAAEPKLQQLSQEEKLDFSNKLSSSLLKNKEIKRKGFPNQDVYAKAANDVLNNMNEFLKEQSQKNLSKIKLSKPDEGTHRKSFLLRTRSFGSRAAVKKTISPATESPPESPKGSIKKRPRHL